MIINHFYADDVTLSEIFCWPILELIELKEDFAIGNGSKIRNNIHKCLLDTNISVIIGESLSGRTSLAKMLFKEYSMYEQCCIMCDGKDLTTHNENNLRDIIESKFTIEYGKTKLERYRQLEPNQRILIIDNFNNIPYHDDRRSKVISLLTLYFDNIIIFSDNEINMYMVCSKIESKHSITNKMYHILYFGNTKRKELTTKWYCLRNEYACGSEEVSQKIISTCDQINILLGSGIVPAAPIYLINMLQNIEAAAPASFSGSQYGFLYESLINKSISTIGNSYKNSGEINIDINILSSLAFSILKNGKQIFTYDELSKTTEYIKKKKIVNANEVEIIKRMLSAKLIEEVEIDTFKFRYPYIFYYFAGRYIAYNLNNNDVKKQIEYMNNRLYNETYGNIIIFVCHFANNIDIIEDILLHSYSLLDKYEEFDFNKHNEIFERSQIIIEDLLVPKDVGNDSDVEKNQNKVLEQRDEAGIQDGSIKKVNDMTDEEADKAKTLTSITTAMKIMDVLGQIIRNYPGDIDGDLKKLIIEEIHKLGMRIIETILITIGDIEKEFIEFIIELVKEKNKNLNREQLIFEIKGLLSSILAGMARGMIKKIAFSLNNESLLPAVHETFIESKSISHKLVVQELLFNHIKNLM